MCPPLIVMNARGASLQGGQLVLSGVAPNSIVFADRPVRAAGHSLTTDLLEEWSTSNSSEDSFAKDPPNATVSVFSKDGSKIRDAVVVLKTAKLEGDRLTFDVDVLEGELTGGDGPAALFIDRFGGGFHAGGFHAGGFHAGGFGGSRFPRWRRLRSRGRCWCGPRRRSWGLAPSLRCAWCLLSWRLRCGGSWRRGRREGPLWERRQPARIPIRLWRDLRLLSLSPVLLRKPEWRWLHSGSCQPDSAFVGRSE